MQRLYTGINKSKSIIQIWQNKIITEILPTYPISQSMKGQAVIILEIGIVE